MSKYLFLMTFGLGMASEIWTWIESAKKEDGPGGGEITGEELEALGRIIGARVVQSAVAGIVPEDADRLIQGVRKGLGG